MIRRLWFGLGGGLLAGSGVGLAEALWVLSQAPTGEYLALVWGALVYGLVGGGLGLGVGALLALLGLAWKRLSDPLAYTLSALAVGLVVGGVVLHEAVRRSVYLELAVGPGGKVLLAGLGLAWLVLGLWLGPVFLTRTPLKILLFPRGTITAWLAVLGLAGLFALAPGEEPQGGAMVPARAPPPELGETPDVLIITVESLRLDSWTGQEVHHLAGQGVLFTEHVVPSSWTRPSVASLLTSQLPAAHGLDTVTARLEADRVTLPEVVRDWGYVSGALPARPDLEKAHGLTQGFDWHIGMASERGWLRSESARGLLLGGWLRRGLRLLQGGELRVEDHHRPVEEVLGETRHFIQANREAGNHYLAWAHLAEPSLPWFGEGDLGVVEHPSGSPEERERAVQAYRSEVQRVDAALDDFFTWLIEAGAWEDLLLVVVGVHGEELFDHGGWGHGQTLYDEVIRTPLVIKRAGRLASAGTVRTQVQLIDIAPTVIAAIGAEAPEPWEGQPIFTTAIEDELEGEGPSQPGRPAVSQLHLGGAVMESIRADGWKLVRSNRDDPRGLPGTGIYDLTEDPGETRNLAGQVGSRQAELSRELRTLIAASTSWRTRPPVPGP